MDLYLQNLSFNLIGSRIVSTVQVERHRFTVTVTLSLDFSM